MLRYARFVEAVSPELVEYKVTVEYIEDRKMVCGQFFGSYFNVNLAKHDVSNWQTNLELMLHELAHTVVRSNDHLHRDFTQPWGGLARNWRCSLRRGRGEAATKCLGGVLILC